MKRLWFYYTTWLSKFEEELADLTDIHQPDVREVFDGYYACPKNTMEAFLLEFDPVLLAREFKHHREHGVYKDTLLLGRNRVPFTEHEPLKD